MLKLLIITSILSTSLFAKTIEQSVESFEKRRIMTNPNVKLKDIKLVFKKEVKDGWYGYLFKLKLKVQDRNIETTDIVFSNGVMITGELKKLENGLSFKNTMYPEISQAYYQEKYRIAGDKKAKHKLLVFSDPLCPNCTTVIPQLIKDANNNPKILSLYYISLPLNMHPTAKILVKATKIAKKQGIENVDFKVYTAKFEQYFDAYDNKDNQKTLNAFNKVLKTNITMKQINKTDLEEQVEADKKLSEEVFIKGTPTLFIDGEVDLTRSKYKRYIK